MQDLILATRNRGKVIEIREGLRSLGLNLLTMDDLPPLRTGEPKEDGTSYLQNAMIKASTLAKACKRTALADDSGLEVDALAGRPGLLSSRYANGSDQDKMEKLMEELKHVPWKERGASFSCVLVIATVTGKSLAVQATCRGLIMRDPRGDHGFGYDPLFFYPPLGKTFGECSLVEKLSVSHRGRALRKLKDKLPEFLAGSLET